MEDSEVMEDASVMACDDRDEIILSFVSCWLGMGCTKYYLFFIFLNFFD